jgi:hypothetical protein
LKTRNGDKKMYDDYLKHLKNKTETVEEALIIEDVKYIKSLIKYDKNTIATRLDIITRKINQEKNFNIKINLLSDKLSLSTALIIND